MSMINTVKGMSCEHYEQTTGDALQDIAGVSDAHADHEAETIVVEGNPDTGCLAQTIEDTGYTAHA